jgi:hypothetical protein
MLNGNEEEEKMMETSKTKGSIRKNFFLVKLNLSLDKKEQEDRNALREKIISKQKEGYNIPKEWIDLVERKLKIDLSRRSKETLNDIKRVVYDKEHIVIKDKKVINNVALVKDQSHNKNEPTKVNILRSLVQ